MPNLVKMQAEQHKNEFTSCTHFVGKGLGASLLCLSVLAGCASNPDKEQPIDTAENTIQTEDITTPENASQEVATEAVSASDTSTPPTPPTTTPNTSTEVPAVAEVNSAPEGEPASNTPNDDQPQLATDTAAASGEIAVTAEEAINSEATANQPLTRSSKNLGKSYGIWTLKGTDNGFCKLKTPTLQIGNKEYSSQIWMDIEEQKIVVNAYMALDIEHPKTGIQIDNQALMPFADRVSSTRAVVSGDMTARLSAAKELHIFINGKEVGKQVLKRNVKLTNMNAAISALRSCSN